MAIPVLVVDSNQEFGILIRQALEETGQFDVSLATSGRAAFDLATAADFQVAIVDFALSDVPGATLIRQLQHAFPDLTTVAIPMADEVPDDLQVDRVMTKPFYLPDLPKILTGALDRPAAEDTPAAEAILAETGSLQQTDVVTGPLPHLSDPLTAALSQMQAPPQAAMIVASDQVLAVDGLSMRQAQSLAATLYQRGVEPGMEQSVAHYVRLGDSGEDQLAYAIPLAGDTALVSLFPGQAIFRTVRATAFDLRDLILDPPPESGAKPVLESRPPIQANDVPTGPLPGQSASQSTDTAPPPTAAPEFEPIAEPSPAPAAASSLEQPPASVAQSLPADWLPLTELSQRQQAMLEMLAVAESPTQAPAAPQFVPAAELPKDWMPSEQPPAALLAALEPAPAPPPTAAPAAAAAAAPPAVSPIIGAPRLEATYHLVFSAILIPRMPQHRLMGALAHKLREWVQHYCLAWDWRAEQIDIKPEYLLLRVRLIPETAPAQAIESLRDEMSKRILEQKPGWVADLPNGLFWARSYLLSAGGSLDPTDVASFLEATRRAQGLRG